MSPEHRSLNTSSPSSVSGKKVRSLSGGPALWMLEQDRYLAIAEGFRTFKNKLLAMQTGRAFSVFMLTGTERSVGVSTIAFNFGLTLAWDLADKKILLVDTHLDRPSLNLAFNLPAGPGFLDHLLGRVSLPEAVRPSQLAGLDLMPAGRSPDQTAPMFDMTMFTRFLDGARKAYDLILLDAAPVLRSSQARMMSAKTDGVILVLEANRTRSEVVAAAQSLLTADGAHLLGCFLNRRRFVIPKWLYRYV